MSGEQEHLDPNRLPAWLYEAAAKADPSALGWLSAGYLAGIAVGKKTGPCMAVFDPAPGLMFPVTCDLHHGHVGGHTDGKGAKWADLPADDSAPVASGAVALTSPA